jgi:hypothetical protein
MFHVDAVGSVTSAVTQVTVVAVSSASRYRTALPMAELICNANSTIPARTVTRKLSNMICVVESLNFFFLTIRFSSKKHKGTNVLCSQLVPFALFVSIIISYLSLSVNTFFGNYHEYIMKMIKK